MFSYTKWEVVLARSLTVLTLAFFNCSLSEEAPKKYDQTWRFPVIAIPKMDTAPAIDGTIQDAEWAKASLFPSLISRDPLAGDGMPPPERTWVWMAYTDDALYWAFRQDLPPQELPVKASVTTGRDNAEARDNTVNILFTTDPRRREQFNISGNPNGILYDRRFDNGQGKYWNPAIEYKAKPTPTGWDGEMKIPFKVLDLKVAPATGSIWNCYFYSAWRKAGTRLFSFPYLGWRQRVTGKIVFGGEAPGVRFEDDGAIRFAGKNAGSVNLSSKLLFRAKSPGSSFYFSSVASAIEVSKGEGATFQSYDDIIDGELKTFGPAEDVKAIGEYLHRFDATLGKMTLASGVHSFHVSPPLGVVVTPYFLKAKRLGIVALSGLNDAVRLNLSVEPGNRKTRTTFIARRAEAFFSTDGWPAGEYKLTAEAVDGRGKVIARAVSSFSKPAPPNWWTTEPGKEPLIPPPWIPLKASKEKVEMLDRVYSFDDDALPSQIVTRGKAILAGPVRLEASTPWKEKKLELMESRSDAVLYSSCLKNDETTIQIRNSIEFDGFMRIDFRMQGPGTIDKLDLVIPFRKEHAPLLQNYYKAPGPGRAVGRFTGAIPDEGYKSPPFITTWLGTDHYGLEFSCESTRNWSMSKPNEAIVVSHKDGIVEFRVRFISRKMRLPSPRSWRTITIGLVATPTKTLLPYLQKARFYDDVHVALLPFDWAGFPAWHPPVKDPALIEKKRAWIKSVHDRGQKLLVNGGWAISVQDKENLPWIPEMFSSPMQNVSYGTAKQYAYCYRTPYAEFLANSFAHNARVLGFDGIRFDTVTPGYVCKSDIHGCLWKDPDGNEWGSSNIFSQREIWKRIYRAFHGGAIKEGILYTPNAAGPIMAVHSFSDHHEIGEGFYQKAPNLKKGYPPDMVRSIMTGEPYGFVTCSNLKMGPLFWNERIAALLVNGAEPRFHDSRHWRAGYAAHCSPAASIWDAWDWVDRHNAQWLGWWENGEYVSVDAGDAETYASIYRQPGKRVLLTVTNYEKEPLDELRVTIHLAKMGFGEGQIVHGEDAITGQPIQIAADGRMMLDVFGQRYRLIKISNNPPTYSENNLGGPLLKDAPDSISKNWRSGNISLEAKSTYVLSAEVRIDKAMGSETRAPNFMGKFSPQIRHYSTISLNGKGITGINNSNRRSGEQPYDQTAEYKRHYLPQWWEKTPGWSTMFLPVRTGKDTKSAQFVVSTTDEGKVVFKNLSLRMVKQ